MKEKSSLKYNEITPKRRLLDINIREVWDYRDLLFLFVKRDFVSTYKQTILGPVWFFIQPIFTTLIFSVIFGRLAELPTDGIPPFLFYLAGITCWGYFSESLMKTSNTFVSNSGLFGKVYFPRLILPLSIVSSNLLKFGVQFLLFILCMLYYVFFKGLSIEMNYLVLLMPLLILMMGGLGLGLGLIVSSMTTKYRDLQFLIVFGVQLFMYATPVVYPLSLAKEKLGDYDWVASLNPMTSIIETFKYSFLGKGTFNWGDLGYSVGFIVVVLVIGVITFNKVERSFMDTV
jgi:lipopolysaccharide transport system permease protein